MNHRLHLALVCASLLLCARTGHSAVFNIPNGDVAALKSAIAIANSNGQPDVINLAANGTYTLTAIENVVDGPSGLPQIANDTAGLDLTINGNSATIQRSNVAGTPEFRILQVNAGAALSCNALTIANGSLTGVFPAERGAGIFLNQATLTLTNCTLRNHRARSGAAIYSSQSAVTLNGSLVTANQAERGAGIYNIEGSINGSGSIFSLNDATGTATGPGAGGGIYSLGQNGAASVTLTDCTFQGNRVVSTIEGGSGAGIYSVRQPGSASVVLTNCTFEANAGGPAFGGAVGNDGGTLSLTNCTLRNNSARAGGAIHSWIGSLEVRSSFFELNKALIAPSTAHGSGGAIEVNQGTLTVVDTTFQKNKADYAGGAIASSGTASVTDSDFIENIANGHGGAITNAAALKLVDSRIELNVAGTAGGIYNIADLSIQRCALSNNTATFAAGGILNGGGLTLENSTLHGNKSTTAGAEGGAIGTRTLNGPIVTTIRNSTLSNNSASLGGGISNIGKLTLMNSTLSGNSATTQGGGLFNKDAESLIGAATFYGNSAPTGGGIYNVKVSASDSIVTVFSTILQAGATGANIVNASGSFFSSGYNLSSDAAGGDNTTGPGGLLNNSDDVRNTDPHLGPLQDNGGLTKTHALLFPSAAIDTGDQFIQILPFRVKTDQRGAGFPRQIGERVDKGAVEGGVNLFVTTLDDHDDGACTSDDCTLREAITAVNAVGIGNISFASGLTGTIQLGSELPDISSNLVLTGPGAQLLTVRRNTGGDYRIFRISNGTTAGPRVAISGLTISNGKTPEGSFPGNSGAGIHNRRGVLTVTRCVLTGNHCTGDATYGGGIFNEEGTIVVRESTLSGNVAAFGGGVANYQVYPGIGRVTLERCTLSGNTGEHGNGGAVYNEAVNANAHAAVSLINCTLSENAATAAGFSGGAGGAIYNFGNNAGAAEVSLSDCTLNGNNAPNTGGIYNHSFSATIARVSLANTILKRGASGDNFLNSSGEIISSGHNISDDAAGGLGGTGPGGYLNATGDKRETDPLLGPLQSNGGPTATHALLANSPAINAGEDVIPSFFDQRGYPKNGTNDIGAFESGAVAPQPPAPLSVVSRKTHGSAGNFDIDLLAIPARTECRSGGATKAFQIVATFANDIILADYSLTSSGDTATAAINVSGKVITIDLGQVADAQTATLTLINVTDEIETGNIVIPFRVLLGDTNGNGVVSATDIGQTKSTAGQSVSAANFRLDLNANGIINSTDIGLVKSRSGTQLP